MVCKDKDLLESYNIYKQNHPSDYKVGYRDYITNTLNYVALEMETAMQNHLVLNFYKQFFTYIKNKHPTLSKSEVYQICNGLYDKNFQLNHPIVLQYRQKLNNLSPNGQSSKKVLHPFYKYMMKYLPTTKATTSVFFHFFH
jgi:hypothetical protein